MKNSDFGNRGKNENEKLLFVIGIIGIGCGYLGDPTQLQQKIKDCFPD